MADFPSHARVVIIGGGAVGCSAAYHLAKAGWTDVLLVEKNELTSGSTWHAAGNCPNYSGSWGMLKLQRYSTRQYATLGDELDYPINYHVTGSIRLAHTKDRIEEFRHVCGMAHLQDLDLDMMMANEIKAAYPFIELHDLEGGLWDPYDGDIDPAQMTQAYAKGARDLGAHIIRFCAVTDIKPAPAGAWDVVTEKGPVRADVVVNAAGYRAAEIGAMVGRDIPCVSMAHQYLVTEDIAELAARDDKLPLLRDVDDSYYLRQERDGLILGPYEWQATPHWVRGDDPMPDDFSFQLYPDDLDRLEWYIESACARVPILGSVGVQKVINGPIPYTPDGNPLIGPAPGLTNFYECCVFSFGISQAGGAGKILADWVVHGEPEWDMWITDPRRYTDYVTKAHVEAKAVELYQNEYAIGYPNEERPAGRPAKTSPVYERLKAKGAMFGARGGWERAAWFPASAEEAVEKLSFHRTNWFDTVAEECRAVAEGVAIMDLPGFSRFEVAGPGAADWLDGLIAGALPRVGKISLAYMCSPRGAIVSEATITRFEDDRFWLLGAASGEWHDRDWLERHLPAETDITIDNVTARWGTLVLAGPKSREVLAQVVDNDLSSNAFPWLTHQPVTVGMGRGTAVRVNYVGELGWELHMPMEYLLATYDLLWAAGEAHGIRDFGMYAMDSLRLEKGYRSWKVDLDANYTPLMASLDRFVRLDKGEFIGRQALIDQQQAGVPQRFVPLLVEAGTADAPFCAVVWKGDERVGLATSGGYGHRIGRSIALAYVRTDLAHEGETVEVDILGERFPAVVGTELLYDPNNERLKA